MARALEYLLVSELTLVVVAALAGLVYERRARKRDQRLYPPPGRLIALDGYRLHLDGRGQGGSTILLAHGHQGSSLDWYRVQQPVAGFARVCAYDRAGYGWSDPSPKRRLPSVMAEELHEALHRAGERPPYILVGHSFGALEVLMFAHKFRDEVGGLVLVDGSLPETLSRFGFGQKLWLRAMEFAIPFGLPRWRRWCGWAATEEIRPVKQALNCRASVYRTIYREWTDFPATSAELRRVTGLGDLPLIVITRDPSLQANSSAAARWQELQRERLTLSSHAEFLIASGSGHAVPLVRPDIIIEALKKLVGQRMETNEQANGALF
jgi:pimeloyl-ACP methyl ester carboxylesterase